jgi:hypothetical protein
MKKVIAIIILALINITGINAQTVQEQIKTIDKQCKEIKNNIGKFKKIVKSEDSTGYKYVYMKDKELQLISLQYKDKNIEKNVDWYVVKGKIVYCETLWINYSTGKRIMDDKNYFNNEHMIAWIKIDGSSIDSNSKDFMDFDSQFAAYAPKLREMSMK